MLATGRAVVPHAWRSSSFGASSSINGASGNRLSSPWASVVRACAELVKPGGWVFFSTINRNPKSFLFAIVGAEYLLRMLPKGTHEYAKMIRPSELAAFCRAAGLSLEQTRGMEFNPLTQRYWLSGDTSVNSLVSTRRP